MANPAIRPATLLPPPLVYATGLAAGWWIDRHFPLGFTAGGGLRGLGWGLVGAGVMLTLWAASTIWRHRTTVNPYKPVSNLVTAGPFAFSRNPIYLGDWLVYTGATLLLNTYWTLVFAPVVWWVMRYHVIAHEEAHLMARFGEAYRDYTNRVRRWI